jgi:hypothetical protein
VDVVSDALEECARGDVDDVALPCTAGEVDAALRSDDPTALNA